MVIIYNYVKKRYIHYHSDNAVVVVVVATDVVTAADHEEGRNDNRPMFVLRELANLLKRVN